MQDIRSLNSQCKIVPFIWKISSVEFNNSDRDETALSAATAIDISKYLLNANYSKNMGESSGNFTFNLPNSHAWNEILEPGQWILMYLSNEGGLIINKKNDTSISSTLKLPGASPEEDNSKLRCLGVIDRVSINYSVGESGEKDISYQITGKDYGKVYEETTVWQNQFVGEGSLMRALKSLLKVESTRTMTDFMTTIHSLFLYPQALKGFSKQRTLTELGLQWLMPSNLVTSFLRLKLKDSKGGSYLGNISDLLNFSKSSLAQPVANALSFIKGDAWSALKSASIQQIHEFFPELDNKGNPKLNFRVIPWGLDFKAYPKISKYADSYFKLSQNKESSFELNSGDVYNFNLGLDNHTRYNHYQALIQNQNQTITSSIDVLTKVKSISGKRYPYLIRSSIKRYGFKDQHITINKPLMSISSDTKKGVLDPFIVQEVNEFMYDIWSSAYLFESGVISIIGNNNTRIGKVVKFSETTEYLGNKVFYIEGYSDNIVIEDNGVVTWDQDIMVTRGITTEALKSVSNIGLNRVKSMTSLDTPRNKILKENKESFDNLDSFVEDGDE